MILTTAVKTNDVIDCENGLFLTSTIILRNAVGSKA